MATLLEAVGGDTFGGLSGYRRPVAGNPTRVPTNLPAFRGVQNKPGDKIGVPAIKSSKNRQNRGTNVLIPYSRVTTYEDREYGGKLPGDLAFLSAFAPNAYHPTRDGYFVTSSGHDVFHYSRLVGLHRLNHMLSQLTETNAAGRHQNVLILGPPDGEDPKKYENQNVLEMWNTVPTLQEFRLDGIVLSDDQPDVNRGATSNELGQLFNISVQGLTPVNNGYVTERGHSMSSRPTPTASLPPFAIPIAEASEEEPMLGDDARKLYALPNEHIYSEQMFSRNIEPQDELFCALVATEFEPLDSKDEQEIKTHSDAKQAVKDAIEQGEPRPKVAEKMNALREVLTDKMKELLQRKTVLDKFKDDKGRSTLGTEQSVVTFQYWLCSSARLIELASTSDNNTEYVEIRDHLKTINHNAGRPQNELGEARCNKKWLKHMVGAWRVGTVMDTKASQVPFFEGGPIETGNRVSVNVGICWMGWRELRRRYTFNPYGPQVGEAFRGKWTRMVARTVYDASDRTISVDTLSRVQIRQTNHGEMEGPEPDEEKQEEQDDGKQEYWPTVLNPAADNGFHKPAVRVVVPMAPVAGSPASPTRKRPRDDPDPDPPGDLRSVDERQPPVDEDPNADDAAPANAGNAAPANATEPANATTAAGTSLESPMELVAPKSVKKAASKKATGSKAAAASSEMEVDAPIDAPAPMPEVPAPKKKKTRGVAQQPVAASSVERARQRVERAPASPAQESPTQSPAANVFARRRSTPSPSPDRPIDSAAALDDVAAAVGAAAASRASPASSPSVTAAAAAAAPANASTSTDAVMDDALAGAEEVVEPKQKKGRARGTSDVFSSIFGGGSDASRLEPLNPAHRGSEKFSRRRRG